MQHQGNKSLCTVPLALVMASVLLAGNVLAGPGPGGQGPEDSPRWERLSEQLALTDAQQAAWQAMLEDEQALAAADRSRLQELRRQLRDVGEIYDAERARALADELGAITARQALRRTEHQAKLYQLLEPEQRERWRKALEQRQPGPGAGGGKGQR